MQLPIKYYKTKKKFKKEVVSSILFAIVPIIFCTWTFYFWKEVRMLDKVLAILLVPASVWLVFQVIKTFRRKNQPFLEIGKKTVNPYHYSNLPIIAKNIKNVYVKCEGKHLFLYVDYSLNNKIKRQIIANDKLFDGNLDTIKEQVESISVSKNKK